MVFQSYALYPHMTVYDNMAFALKMRGAEGGDRAARPARQRSCSSSSEFSSASRGALRRPAPARRDGPGDRARARRSS